MDGNYCRGFQNILKRKISQNLKGKNEAVNVWTYICKVTHGSGSTVIVMMLVWMIT